MSKGTSYLTVTEIARLAGVRPSAVSNWRRRHSDFPDVVRRGPSGDLFDPDEVRDWMLIHRPPQPHTGDRERWTLKSVMRLGRHDDVLEIALALVCLLQVSPELAVGIAPSSGELEVADVIAEAAAGVQASRENVDSVFERLRADGTERELTGRIFRWLMAGLRPAGSEDTQPARHDLLALFEQLLDLRAQGRSRSHDESRTADWTAELLVALAGADDGLVFDPAAGEAGFLLRSARAATKSVRLVGWERDPVTLRIARQRLLIHGVRADLEQVDSLDEHHLASRQADAVVCDPPFGARERPDRWSPTDPRWRFGIPAPIADLAWVQLAIHHLAPVGRAAVLLPAASLARGGFEARIRVELLTAGAIEAIIALPPGTALHTDIPVALWLLRRPPTRTPNGPAPILFVDASRGPGPGTGGHARAAQRRRKNLKPTTGDPGAEIVNTVFGWRANRRTAKLAPGFAAAVKLEELLEGEADLVPARWVQTRATTRETQTALDQSTQRFNDLRSSIAKLPPVGLPVPPATNPRRQRIRDLIKDERVELIPGSRIQTTETPPHELRVWGPWDFRGEPKRHAPAQPDAALTNPHDIIIQPVAGAFIAIVDHEGGHALATPVQALRILTAAQSDEEFLDPTLIAALISDPDTTRLATTTTTGRNSVQSVELPILDRHTAQQLARVLESIELTREAAAAGSELQRTLLRAANSGWRVARDI